MSLFAFFIAAPYLGYLIVMTLFVFGAALYVGFTTLRWFTLTLLCCLLWPLVWIEEKLHSLHPK